MISGAPIIGFTAGYGGSRVGFPPTASSGVLNQQTLASKGPLFALPHKRSPAGVKAPRPAPKESNGHLPALLGGTIPGIGALSAIGRKLRVRL